ncbi:uncharacterized protein [Dasypus novemcinctus]|uniref:uncharacterized protein n=1 Tax=Dasypus novemcinctus TaxID=9361 RepID=UPI00265FA5AF|nr:uncharacterized protein LOC131277917 [Dasypus novemcinctus]
MCYAVGATAPLRAQAGVAGAPHPLPASPRPRKGTLQSAPVGLPPHFSGSCEINCSSCSKRLGVDWGKEQRQPQSQHGRLPRSRACPAQDPEARRAQLPNAPLPRREQRRSPLSPVAAAAPNSLQPQLPRVGGVGGVAGWKMLLPTEGRRRNGNRNRRRRLTEPSAPLTKGEREKAQAGQELTARGRARVGSRARDSEPRQPHSARRGVVAAAAQPLQPTPGRSAAAGSAIMEWHRSHMRLSEVLFYPVRAVFPRRLEDPREGLS